MEQRYPYLKYFDMVKISLNLEAIKAEFTSRDAAERLKAQNPGRGCVCDIVQGEDVGLLWNMENANHL